MIISLSFFGKDSLVDLVNGLGVPLEQMLMGVTSVGSVFTLKNNSITIPRAPALGIPIHATYSQVNFNPGHKLSNTDGQLVMCAHIIDLSIY